MNVDQLHELARMFMNNFLYLEPLSLDEFLVEYKENLTTDQIAIGNYILSLFDE